jgi:hypothetical protein
MKKLIKHIITKLFFKYCYVETEMAQYLINYYVPNTMKKLNGEKIDGQFLFAQINEKGFEPFLDVPVSNIKGIK